MRTETVQEKKDSSPMMNPFQLQQKEVQEFLLLLEEKKKSDVYKVTKTPLLVVDYEVQLILSEHCQGFLLLPSNMFSLPSLSSYPWFN